MLLVAPKSPPVVCWPAIGQWQSAIGVPANHKPQHNWRGISTATLSPATQTDPRDWTLIVTYQIFPTTIRTAPTQIHRLLMVAEHPLFSVVVVTSS